MNHIKEWNQMLTKIAENYDQNQQVQQSVSFLKSIIEGKAVAISKNVQLLPEQMPLPKEIKKKNQIAVFSDGACLGNPGPGSWAAFAQNNIGEVIFESSSFDGNTTNNRMELQGVINGLLRVIDHSGNKSNSFEVFVYSDSKYVVDGANQWMPNWKKNGWKKADQKIPENLVLWQKLDLVLSDKCFIKVHLHWVKGHAGHAQNEYCDRLCQTLLKQVLGQ